MAAHDEDDGEADADEINLLPRRVRQASLAPQLRETGYAAMPGSDSSPDPDTEDVQERSPDEARSTITAIQQGWQRGRSLFDASGKSSETLAGTGALGALTGPAPAEPAPAEPDTAEPEDVVPAATGNGSNGNNGSSGANGLSDAAPAEAEHTDAEYTDAEHTDAEYTDAEHTDAEYTDAEHTDAEHTDAGHTDEDGTGPDAG
jgi:hypothetical protein